MGQSSHYHAIILACLNKKIYYAACRFADRKSFLGYELQGVCSNTVSILVCMVTTRRKHMRFEMKLLKNSIMLIACLVLNSALSAVCLPEQCVIDSVSISVDEAGACSIDLEGKTVMYGCLVEKLSNKGLTGKTLSIKNGVIAGVGGVWLADFYGIKFNKQEGWHVKKDSGPRTCSFEDVEIVIWAPTLFAYTDLVFRGAVNSITRSRGKGSKKKNVSIARSSVRVESSSLRINIDEFNFYRNTTLNTNIDLTGKILMLQSDAYDIGSVSNGKVRVPEAKDACFTIYYAPIATEYDVEIKYVQVRSVFYTEITATDPIKSRAKSGGAQVVGTETVMNFHVKCPSAPDVSDCDASVLGFCDCPEDDGDSKGEEEAS